MFPYVLLFILLIRSLLLPGAYTGIKYLFTPRLDKLLNSEVIIILLALSLILWLEMYHANRFLTFVILDWIVHSLAKVSLINHLNSGKFWKSNLSLTFSLKLEKVWSPVFSSSKKTFSKLKSNSRLKPSFIKEGLNKTVS